MTAEIPGLEVKDIDVLLNDGVLTLKGEKRSETEDKEKQFSERFYGRFERRIPLGVEVEEDKVDARFKNGVLSIVLPKSAKAQSEVKRIAIKHPSGFVEAGGGQSRRPLAASFAEQGGMSHDGECQTERAPSKNVCSLGLARE